MFVTNCDTIYTYTLSHSDHGWKWYLKFPATENVHRSYDVNSLRLVDIHDLRSVEANNGGVESTCSL